MRYIITLCLDNLAADLQAVKEAIAYDCEKYGDISLIDIREEEKPKFEQLSMEKKETQRW